MQEINPYLSPLAAQPMPVARAKRKPIAPLIGAYLGTTCAGGMFGLMGGLIGFIIGLILAGAVGAFVFTITNTLANLLWSRVSVGWLSTTAGALTGFFSLSMFLLPGLATMGIEQLVYGFGFALIPASLGAIGGFLGAVAAGANRSR